MFWNFYFCDFSNRYYNSEEYENTYSLKIMMEGEKSMNTVVVRKDGGGEDTSTYGRQWDL